MCPSESGRADYRIHPLLSLMEEQRFWWFDRPSVTASKDRVSPNGPMDWFERRGFKDKGVLITEELHKAEMHYLQLVL